MDNYLYIGNINILDKKEDYDKAYSSLSKQRKEKVDRLKFLNDKKLSILAELLLKKALKDCGIYSSFEYKYNNHEKPYLDDINNIKFNISHSIDYTICLISTDDVGCDIEQIKEIDLKIADKFFSKEESSFLNESNNKIDTFYRFWTLKESFIKSIGQGLNIDLKSFTFDLNCVDIKQKINNNKYFFKEIDIEGYKCSLCLLNNKPLKIETIDNITM